MLRINNKIDRMYNQILSLDFASKIDAAGIFSFQLPLSQCLGFLSRRPLVKKVHTLKEMFCENCKLDSDKITVSVEQNYGRPVTEGKITRMGYDFSIEVCFGSFVLYKTTLNNTTEPVGVAEHVAKLPSCLLEWLQRFLDDYEDFLWENFPANNY